MPSAIQYLPPSDAQRDQLISDVLLERSYRNDAYRTALKYYYGKQPDQLEVTPDQPDDNVSVNLVKMTADRTVSFLFPEIPRIELDPGSIEDTPDEVWLKEFFEVNGGLPFLIKWALRGFLAGHTFIRLKPPTARKEYPTMTLLDPMAVTAYWRADDVAEILWYENRYFVGRDIYVEDYVWMPDAGLRGEWHIYTYKGVSVSNVSVPTPHGSGTLHWDDRMGHAPHSSDLYNLYASGVTFTLVPTDTGADFAVHGSPIPPIIETAHLPNPDDYYGQNEVSFTDLQDTINRLWSEINQIARLYSDPKDVIIGADVDDVEDGGNILTVPSPAAKVTRLEMKSDLSAAVDTVNKLVEIYLALARVVLLKGEAKDLQRVTNASVRTLFLDALSKNSILQSSYGSTLKKIVRLALQMVKRTEDVKPVIRFGSPLPIDLTEIANINAIQAGLGARSARTAATLVGDDPAFEQEAIKAEQAMKLEQRKTEAEFNVSLGFNPDGSMKKKEESNAENEERRDAVPADGNRN